MSTPPIRSLTVLAARWAALPAISAWFGQLEQPELGWSWLMDKIATVLDEPYEVADHLGYTEPRSGIGIAPFIRAYVRGVSYFVTLPELVALDDPLAEQRTRLDALGPHIAAYCVPDEDLEGRCVPICVRLALQIASGWLAATGVQDLTEHATTLKAIAEAETVEYASAAEAAREAFRAVEGRSWQPESAEEAEQLAAVYQAVGATEDAAAAARRAALDAPEPLDEYDVTRVAAAPASAAVGEWDTGESGALWSAREATVSDPAWWAGAKTRSADEWWAAAGTRAAGWSAGLTPPIRAHIQADADALLETLETLIERWKGKRT